jgi:hypothetical protein
VIDSVVKIPRGGGVEYLQRGPASHRGYEKGTQCLEYNWDTLFLGDINTGTWPSRLGGGGVSDLRQ